MSYTTVGVGGSKSGAGLLPKDLAAVNSEALKLPKSLAAVDSSASSSPLPGVRAAASTEGAFSTRAFCHLVPSLSFIYRFSI